MQFVPKTFIAILIIVICSGLFSTNLSAAKVYTWKDANGVVHYSDKPVSKARQAKQVVIKAARPKLPQVEENQQSNSELSESDLNNQLGQALAQDILSAEEARVKTECSKARKNLITLASGKSIQRRNADGEKVALGEDEIRAEVQRNQLFINTNCKPKDSAQEDYDEFADEGLDEQAEEEVGGIQ